MPRVMYVVCHMSI